ncbi:hypothetical protein I5730_14610 [Acinetobacter nosocomialis]|uniref:hypothetical protein n=1 Tax=Acinetobacter TaxID=469 RepID=UPI001900E9BE|nr:MULTISPECIES: hypothetical protein [Acinetobacter]MBJ9961772.1 hypothetical protein [Acinetobacter nosocomialis]MCO8114684.1 hypothetical protein [Acinetobacter lwoffii]
MSDKTLTFKCLSFFEEPLERKAFELHILSMENFTPEYLKRSLLDDQVYANPLIEAAWQSWRYRAVLAISLYKGEKHHNS